MVDKKTTFEYKGKILQIYEGETPLTQIQTVRIMSNLKDVEIKETANRSVTGAMSVNAPPLYCDNPKHDHYKKCVGGGVCLAKKYKRLDVFPDQICQGCRSKVIVDTLNYIFNTYYEGKYRAEWRSSRRAPKPIKEKKNPIKKTREAVQDVLQNMPVKKMPARPKRGRPLGSKNKKVKEIKVIEPEKKRRGRPRKEDKELPVVAEKKPRGRPRIKPLVAAAA